MKNIIEQKRGQLTERILERSKELLGYEINQAELRLMPYLHYQLVNEKRLKPEHINADDRKILMNWVEKGYILNGVTPRLGRPMMSDGEKLKVTKCFWSILNEIVFLGYVDLTE